MSAGLVMLLRRPGPLEEQQFIPVMAKEPAARNCWAPEITYDVKKKRYVIYGPLRFRAGFRATLGRKRVQPPHLLYHYP